MLNHKMLYSLILIVTVLAFAVGCSTAPVPATSATSKQPADLAGSGGGGVQPITVLSQPAPVAGRGITVVGTGKASGTWRACPSTTSASRRSVVSG